MSHINDIVVKSEPVDEDEGAQGNASAWDADALADAEEGEDYGAEEEGEGAADDADVEGEFGEYAAEGDEDDVVKTDPAHGFIKAEQDDDLDDYEDKESDLHPGNFCKYVESGDEAKVRELLEQKPALCNLRSKKHHSAKTPLCVACWYGHVALAECLLEYGAEIVEKLPNGEMVEVTAHRSAKKKEVMTVQEFAQESAVYTGKPKETAKLMLVIELYLNGEDYEVLREIAYESVIPEAQYDRFEDLIAEAKQRVHLAQQAESGKNEARPVKWEDPTNARSRAAPLNPAPAAPADNRRQNSEFQEYKRTQDQKFMQQQQEMEMLRQQVQDLKSKVGGNRPRSRSPRREFFPNPRADSRSPPRRDFRPDPRADYHYPRADYPRADHRNDYYADPYPRNTLPRNALQLQPRTPRFANERYQVKAENRYGYGQLPAVRGRR